MSKLAKKDIFLYDEHELPWITDKILLEELLKAAEELKETNQLWIAEVCRVAYDHIRGLQYESRWLRIKNNWDNNEQG